MNIKRGVLSYTCELSGLHHCLVILEKINKLDLSLNLSSTTYSLNLNFLISKMKIIIFTPQGLYVIGNTKFEKIS